MYYKGGEENDMTIVNSLNAADQTKVGNRLPTYTGGLGTRVNWGGFYADANFYFSGGNKIYERWNWYSQSTGLTIYSITTKVLLHLWTDGNNLVT